MSTSRQQRRLLYERLVGQTVADRYQIVRLMGFGGMGAVYEAVDRNMQRPVALKYIPAHDPVAAERFKREALTVSNLRHRNTVTVYDRGQTNDGFLFLSMELLEGQTLTDLIKNESPLSAERVVHIASQICRSLAEAHELGVVHRDVKPDNVILIHDDGDPDTVKVLDFGIAKAISGEDDVQLTGDGRIIGTPRYMSPEQILGHGVDNRSDIYSLGCIIFEMLCGAPPFQGSTTTALMISHAQDAPPPFAERLAEEALFAIPLALEQVVRRAMAKDPAQRPQSTEILRQELEEALIAHKAGRVPSFATPANATSDRAPLPGPAPEQSQAPEKSTSSTKPLIVGILILLLLIAALGAAVFFINQDEPSGPPVVENPADDEPSTTLAGTEEIHEEPRIPTQVIVDETVHLRVLSEPSGASVIEAGRIVGSTPYNVSISADTTTVNYVLRADGYEDLDANLEIDAEPGGDQIFSFELQRERRRGSQASTSSRGQSRRNDRNARAEEKEPAEEATVEAVDETPDAPFVPILEDEQPRINRL